MPIYRRIYSVSSGSAVTLEVRLFTTNNNRLGDRAVIFLPGWSIGARAKSIQSICEAFSRASHTPTHAIAARVHQRLATPGLHDYLFDEAEAIKNFLQQHVLKRVLIVGHSQGADRAISLVASLSDDPMFRVDGLVLIAPVGLYPQRPSQLVLRFLRDSLLKSPAVIKHCFDVSSADGIRKFGILCRAAGDILKGIISEIRLSGLSYPSRFKSEVAEMARVNPKTGAVRVPVVIIMGYDDMVSNPRKFFENSLPQVFQHSLHISTVTAKKLGVHGLPFLRPKATAAAGVYLVERSKRRNGR